MHTDTKTETHRQFIARVQRTNDALIRGYRNGTITSADLNRMVNDGQITVARRNITIGSAV